MLKIFNQHPTKTIFAISAIMAITYLSPGLFAKFGIIDDHEIINFLYEKDRNGIIGGFVPSLKSTEVVSYGEASRFRPSYYPLRILESFIYGENVFIWYFVRMVGYFFSTFIIFYITVHIFGLAWAVPISLASCTFPYWADIFARLGPGEFYVTIGCSMVAWGIFNIYRSLNLAKPHLKHIVAITLGCLMAMGSKEYFIVLTLPVALIFLLSLKRKGRLSLGECLSAAIIFSYAGFIFLALAIYFSSHSVDVYSQSISLNERGMILGEFFGNKHGLVFVLEVVFMFIISCLKYRQKKLSNLSPMIFFIVIFIGIMVAMQIVFNGVIYSHMRYAYPWALLLTLNHIIFFYWIYLHYPIAAVRYVFWVLCFVILVKNSFGFKILRESLNNVERTTIFDKKMSYIKNKLDKDITIPVVLSVNDPLDSFEQVGSFVIYARYREIKNVLYLCANYGIDAINTPRKERLHQGILNRQNNGNELLRPLGDINRNEKYFVIDFGVSKYDVCDLEKEELLGVL